MHQLDYACSSKFVDDAIAKGGTSKVIATFITKASEALNFLVSKLAALGSKFRSLRHVQLLNLQTF